MSSRYLRTGLSLAIVTCGAALSFACGSSDDETGSNATGTGGPGQPDDGTVGGLGVGTAGTSSGPGGPGTVNPGSGMHDGGTLELTPDQVAAISGSACTAWSGEGVNLPAVLQLVVDVSGSMEDDAPGGNGSKWDVTQAALRDAIETLPDTVSVGVLYYPNKETGESDTPLEVSACVATDEMVPIAELGTNGHRDVVLDSLNQANTGSYTPTHDAYRYALAQSLMPYETPYPKFMLLITDGAPTRAMNCIGENGNGGDPEESPTQPIINEVAGASQAGIRTFLIGSPGSEESSSGNDMRPWLSQAAIEGGTAATGCDADGPAFCHMDMTEEPDFSQALTDGLGVVVGQVIDVCTFAIPDPPSGETIDANKTNLIINWSDGSTSLILPDDTGDCSEGWQFSGADQVTLCSASCDAVKADIGASALLQFGCTTDEVILLR
jgi:hypothetical protein